MTIARLRLQGLLQLLRHQGIHHRGPEELLGRQVLGQVPQALAHRPQAGDRGPVRLPRAAARGAAPATPSPARSSSALPAGSASGIPRTMTMFDRYPFWQPLLHRAGRRGGAVAGHRSTRSPPRASSWRWRSPATRCRWRTATCRRCIDRAWTTSWCPTCWTRRPTDGSLHRALLPLEPDPALRACESAPGLEEHRAQVPGAPRCTSSSAAIRSRADWPKPCGGWASAATPSDRAVDAAYAAQREFQSRLLEAGRRALDSAGARPASPASCWSAAATTSTTATSTATSRASCATATAPTSSPSISW